MINRRLILQPTYVGKTTPIVMKPADTYRNILTAHDNNMLILPNNQLHSLDTHITKRNNNIVVIGGSGSGKTRSMIIPNLLSMIGSYIISDPKGNLYSNYSEYLLSNGYDVIHLDFIHPERSDGYSPFHYIRTTNDIAKLSHYLTYAGKNPESAKDPFWDLNSDLLLSSIIGYMVSSDMPKDQLNTSTISELLTNIDAIAIEDGKECKMDRLFKTLVQNKWSKNVRMIEWSYKQYLKFRQNPPKTMNCIISTLHGNLNALDTPEICHMMSGESVDFESIGKKKTVVFVEVSDTDRSKDMLINTFFTQAVNALCTFADEECESSSLPVPVRFFLDDFGTNCKIENFENMLSNIRSRNISALIILQSVSQLKKGYGESAHTIIDNCDTMIYMGGNDVDTAATVSKKANKPLAKILNMSIGTNWVFRRGDKPEFSKTVDLNSYALPAIQKDTEKREPIS